MDSDTTQVYEVLKETTAKAFNGYRVHINTIHNKIKSSTNVRAFIARSPVRFKYGPNSNQTNTYKSTLIIDIKLTEIYILKDRFGSSGKRFWINPADPDYFDKFKQIMTELRTRLDEKIKIYNENNMRRSVIDPKDEENE